MAGRERMEVLSTGFEREAVPDGTGRKIVDGYLQFAITDGPFDDGRELSGVFATLVARASEAHLRTTADDLCPRAFGRWGVIAIAVLMRSDNQLTACRFQ